MTAVHQFIPSFAPRTAVGDHTLQVRRLLHDLGIESEVYVGEAREAGRVRVHPFRDFAPTGAPTWLLYQCSTGSPMADFLVARPEPKVVDYHNITPASLFGPWEPHVGAELRAGRRQLAELAPVTELGIADSGFNRDELDAVGYRRSVVVPILLDLDAFGAVPPDRAAVERLSAGPGARWLFVGRISPNKAQHDLVKALAVYRRVYDPDARLRLVGGSSSHAYLTALQRFITELGLSDAVDFAPDVTLEELRAHFEAADVFVVASDHEGFCVPLLEAWHHRLPIVATASTAVPETLGDGGLLLPRKAPALFAASAARVVGDGALREALVAAGSRRLADFALPKTRARFADAITSLVGAAA